MRIKTIAFLWIAALCIVGADASPVKSIVAAEGEVYEVESDGPSCRDYIQDGLVALWDGIWNSVDEFGNPCHETEPTVWVDLVGAADMSIDDSRIAVTVNDNSISKAREAGYGTYYFAETRDAALMDLLNGGTGYTMEICARKDEGWTGDPDYWLDCLHPHTALIQTYRSNKDINFYTRNNTDVISMSGVNLLARFTVACSQEWDGGHKEMFFNGEKVSEGDQPNSYDFSGKRVALGERGAARTYFCVRLYNRCLTAEEVKYNALIDRIRYGAY